MWQPELFRYCAQFTAAREEELQIQSVLDERWFYKFAADGFY